MSLCGMEFHAVAFVLSILGRSVLTVDEVGVVIERNPIRAQLEKDLVISHAKDFWHRTATAGSDVVQTGRPIFDGFFQHLWPYIGNNTVNVIFQMVKRLKAYPHRPMTLHSPTENSLAVLNHKILEVNSQVQNVKLGGHQTCLSINRLWHELCDMLRRLVGTTAPGHHDCSIQE
ncbi:uncharacterized protein TNCV_296161 [Trichonephila clavipes]|nr:uncharacterized protein TNCV_296161 [Trichonephila clavipes]